jgi:predicted dehydrogenase
MTVLKFGVIGSGLMGKEFASAAARWCHLPDLDVRPELVALCSRSPAFPPWWQQNFSSIRQYTTDYRALLSNPEVEAVYVAVPHHLHREIYCAVLEAGKHLLGEKPFGIDLPACEAILASAKRHDNLMVRCSSEFPFFPGVQRIGDMLENGLFGQILEVQTGFLHSSDLDPNKAINWKRMIEFNGEYGVLGDLGMHACHVPFRAGWVPQNVRAILSNVIKERPDGKNGRAPCRTWDNATLLCQNLDPVTGESFPWLLRTQRIAPGQKNNWYLEIYGTRSSARWSSTRADILEVLEYTGGEQVWGQIQMGQETAFKSITGGIFQFGFSDAIVQMWAAFLYELKHGNPVKKFAGCVRPEETLLSHRLFTAALASQKRNEVISL